MNIKRHRRYNLKSSARVLTKQARGERVIIGVVAAVDVGGGNPFAEDGPIENTRQSVSGREDSRWVCDTPIEFLEEGPAHLSRFQNPNYFPVELFVVEAAVNLTPFRLLIKTVMSLHRALVSAIVTTKHMVVTYLHTSIGYWTRLERRQANALSIISPTRGSAAASSHVGSDGTGG